MNLVDRPFSRLQSYRLGEPILYYAFDILSHKGKSLLKTAWTDRREILATALPSNPLFHLSATFDADPATVIKAVREFNLEGVIAKRKTSIYEPGKRSGAWIKHRVLTGQEFVVGGFTPSEHGIDAIVIGYYKSASLAMHGSQGAILFFACVLR